MRDATLARQEREKGFEQTHETFMAQLVSVDYSDSPNVARQPGFVWFQEIAAGDPTAGIAFNRKVPALVGLRVTIKRWPKKPWDYEVIDWDADQVKNLASFTGNPLLVQHARDHEPGGYDPLNIYAEMMVMLRTDPGGGLTVNVGLYRYSVGGTAKIFGGYNGYDLSAYVPAADLARYVLVYLDAATNALGVVSGDTSVDLDTEEPTRPDLPSRAIASSFVRLSGGQTTIERTDIKPGREWLRINNDGGASPAEGEVVNANTGVVYTSLGAAILAASSNDLLVLGPGVFAISSLVISSPIRFKGQGKGVTILRDTNDNTFALGVTSILTCQDLSVENVTVLSGNNHASLYVYSGGYILAYRCAFSTNVSATGGTTAKGAMTNNGDIDAYQCDFSGTGATTSYGLSVELSGDAIFVEHGRISGDTNSIYSVSGVDVDLKNPLIEDGFTGSGSASGWYIDSSGDLISAGGATVTGGTEVESPANDILNPGTTHDDSDFVATINGAPSGTSVVYNAPSSGDENNLAVNSSSHIAKLVLHNTTRGDDALIESCNTGTNTITLTANAPGTWQSGDTITIRSQTNTSTVSSAYFVDFEFTSTVDSDDAWFLSQWTIADSGGQVVILMHPYEANDNNKRRQTRSQTGTQLADGLVGPIELISNRFCVAWRGSGTSTITTQNARLTLTGKN